MIDLRADADDDVVQTHQAVLRALQRRFPKSYWPSFDKLTPSERITALDFLTRLDSRPFGLDDITDVVIDRNAVSMQSKVHVMTLDGFGSGGEAWSVSSDVEAERIFRGYKVLKQCKDEANKLIQPPIPPSYVIENCILLTTGGDDNWNGVVDLSQYEHFWWEQNVLKASKDAKTCLNMYVSNLSNLQVFKSKMLSDIAEVLKELKPCVKK